MHSKDNAILNKERDSYASSGLVAAIATPLFTERQSAECFGNLAQAAKSKAATQAPQPPAD